MAAPAPAAPVGSRGCLRGGFNNDTNNDNYYDSY